jgi:hypothetical protein
MCHILGERARDVSFKEAEAALLLQGRGSRGHDSRAHKNGRDWLTQSSLERLHIVWEREIVPRRQDKGSMPLRQETLKTKQLPSNSPLWQEYSIYTTLSIVLVSVPRTLKCYWKAP